MSDLSPETVLAPYAHIEKACSSIGLGPVAKHLYSLIADNARPTGPFHASAAAADQVRQTAERAGAALIDGLGRLGRNWTGTANDAHVTATLISHAGLTDLATAAGARSSAAAAQAAKQSRFNTFSFYFGCVIVVEVVACVGLAIVCAVNPEAGAGIRETVILLVFSAILAAGATALLLGVDPKKK